MRRPVRFGALVFALLLIAGGGWKVWQARRQVPTLGATAKTAPSVELAASDIAPATVRELRQGVPISGSLKAVQSAVLKARVAGELLGLTVREGDSVRAGQVLARIDPVEVEARLKQAQQQADAARTQIELAQRQFDNNRALVDQGFISKTALDTSQSNLNAAQATHLAAMAAVDLARKSVSDAVLRAPIAGQVAQRLAQPGERVAVDGRVLEIVDLSHMELEASLSAAESIAVRIGQAAELQVEGTAGLVQATVARINPSTQAGSRSVLVYLAIAPGSGLRQGLFAQGFLGTTRARSLAVPLSAVRTDKPAPYVQVLQDRRVVHVPVVPGLRGIAAAEAGITPGTDGLDRQALVAVTGLTENALVIQASAGPLVEGTAVRLTAASPASSAPVPSARP